MAKGSKESPTVERTEKKKRERAEYFRKWRAAIGDEKKKQMSKAATERRKKREKKEKDAAKKSRKAKKNLEEKRNALLKKKAICMRRLRERKKLKEATSAANNLRGSGTFDDFLNEDEEAHNDLFVINEEAAADELQADVEKVPPLVASAPVTPEVQKLQEELEKMKQQNAELKKKLSEKRRTPPVGALLKRTLSPATKKKVDRAASSIANDSPPLRNVVRKLGFNDRAKEPRVTVGSHLKTEIAEFARENSVPNPDVRRGLGKINKSTGEREPIRYRISTLKVLHSKFSSDGTDVSLSHFSQMFPKTIIIPKPEDWGTCLCQKCTNPRLKFLALQKLALSDVPENPEEALLPNEESVPQSVTFMKWEKSDADSRIKKTKKTYSKRAFLGELEEELNTWTIHLKNAMTQFRAIRRAKERAETNSGIKVVQLDWSENFQLRESMEIQSAFFNSEQLAIHPMVCWSDQTTETAAAISKVRSHRAAAVWASLSPILDQWIGPDIEELILVSDSPTSQYRNRWAVALLSDYIQRKGIPKATWIYTEVGHGKGASDGVGAAVKMGMKRVMANPSSTIDSAEDMKKALECAGTSVKLCTYNENDVSSVKRSDAFRNAPAMKGIGKCHEVTVDGPVVKLFATSGGKVLNTLSVSFDQSEQPSLHGSDDEMNDSDKAAENTEAMEESFRNIEIGDYGVFKFRTDKKGVVVHYVGKVTAKRSDGEYSNMLPLEIGLFLHKNKLNIHFELSAHIFRSRIIYSLHQVSLSNYICFPTQGSLGVECGKVAHRGPPPRFCWNENAEEDPVPLEDVVKLLLPPTIFPGRGTSWVFKECLDVPLSSLR